MRTNSCPPFFRSKNTDCLVDKDHHHELCISTSASLGMSSSISTLKLSVESNVSNALRLIHRSKHDGTIERVDLGFHQRTRGETLSAKQFVTILDAVAEFRNLKTLALMCFGECFVPAHALERILLKARSLQILCLYSVTVSGDKESFQDLADTVACHPQLRRVSLRDFSPQEGRSLDSFFLSLSNLPTLTMILLDRVQVSEECMHRIASSPHLRDLFLYSFPRESSLPHNQRVIMQLSKSLGSPETALKSLRIRSCSLRRDTATIFFQMLSMNKSVECLFVTIESWESFGKSIGEMLRDNKTLKRLEIKIQSSDEDLLDEDAIAIVESLQLSNRSLKHFSLSLDSVSSQRLEEAFLNPKQSKLLKGNLHLEAMNLEGMEGCKAKVDPDLLFHFKLNRAGRSDLLQCDDNDIFTRDKWIRALSAHSHDVSVLFHLLSTKPTICQSP